MEFNYGIRMVRAWVGGTVAAMIYYLIWSNIPPDGISEAVYSYANNIVLAIGIGSFIFIPLNLLARPGDRKTGIIFPALTLLGGGSLIFWAISSGWQIKQWGPLTQTDLTILLKDALKYLLPGAFLSYFPPLFVYFKERMNENATFRSWFIEGRGASARWAGPGTYRRFSKNRKQNENSTLGVTSDSIFLGRTLFSDNAFDDPVYVRDDAHLLTVGQTGSGKSVVSIHPNLAMYNGSMIVMNPKGEHADLFYDRRKQLNEGVFNLDPFSKTRKPRSQYNLLSEIDIKDKSARKRISAVTSSCIILTGGENQFWQEVSRFVLDGGIAHLLSRYPKENHNRPFLADLMVGKDAVHGVADPDIIRELHIEMRTNDAAGGLPQYAATLMDEIGERGYGYITAEILTALKWATDPNMRAQISASDFKFADFNKKTMTVFISLPFGDMVEQNRWLRSITNVSMRILEDFEDKPALSVVYVLDELKQYGAQLEPLRDGVVTLRSAGIKLWTFVQNAEQLRHCFGAEGAKDFESSSTIQIYGVNDTDTAKWASEKLGQRMQRKKTGFVRRKTVEKKEVSMLEASTVSTKLGKTAKVQIVFPNEGFPMRLERMGFKEVQFTGSTDRVRGLNLDRYADEP